MLKFGTLKKKLQSVKINKKKAKEIYSERPLHEEEIPIEVPIEEDEVVSVQPFTYKDILFRVLCLSEDGEDEGEALEILKKVFVVSQNEIEKSSVEVNEKLWIYKHENIVEHSLLMIEMMKYDFDNSQAENYSTFKTLRPQTLTVMNSHAKFKHLNRAETAFAKWTAFNEISRIYSLHPSLFNELMDSLTSSDLETKSLRLKTEIDGVAEDFWKYSEMFIRSCLDFIENLPLKDNFEAKQDENILTMFLEVVNKLQKCNPPSGDHLVNRKFRELVKESLALGVNKYLLKVVEKSSQEEENKLLRIMKIVDGASEKYQKMVEPHESSFRT